MYGACSTASAARMRSSAALSATSDSTVMAGVGAPSATVLDADNGIVGGLGTPPGTGATGGGSAARSSTNVLTFGSAIGGGGWREGGCGSFISFLVLSELLPLPLMPPNLLEREREKMRKKLFVDFFFLRRHSFSLEKKKSKKRKSRRRKKQRKKKTQPLFSFPSPSPPFNPTLVRSLVPGSFYLRCSHVWCVLSCFRGF